MRMGYTVFCPTWVFLLLLALQAVILWTQFTLERISDVLANVDAGGSHRQGGEKNVVMNATT